MKITLFTLPNLMTLGNLLCGCLGLMWATEGQLVAASYCIFIALGLDFGDGFVARLLKQSSPLGQQLDSLADAVTFGVLPSFMIKHFLEQAGIEPPYAYFAFSLALFSVVRLAKFNIDTRQQDQFIGLPTPANALVVASLPFMLHESALWVDFFYGTPFLLGYTALISYLLIAEIPLLAFKFKQFTWRGNETRLSFLAVAVLLLAVGQWLAVPVVVLGYVALSLGLKWVGRI